MKWSMWTTKTLWTEYPLNRLPENFWNGAVRTGIFLPGEIRMWWSYSETWNSTECWTCCPDLSPTMMYRNSTVSPMMTESEDAHWNMRLMNYRLRRNMDFTEHWQTHTIQRKFWRNWTMWSSSITRLWTYIRIQRRKKMRFTFPIRITINMFPESLL